MAKPIKRHLKVGTAPEDDEGTLLIRMHPDDLPKGIKWNRYIRLHVHDNSVSCRVRNNELAEVPHPRVHQININRELRNVLGVKSGKIYDFYVSKACLLKAPYYVMKYHPSGNARRKMLLKILGVVVAVCIVVGGTLYYFLGYK